jgi:hypothetical protein
VSGDISQGVAARIAVGGRVGKLAAADAVEHDEEDTAKRSFQSQEFGEK